MNFAYMLGEWFPKTYFGSVIKAIAPAIKYGIFCIIQGICRFFIYLPELMFKLVTGTGSEWVWGAPNENQTIIGGSTGNDIVMAFLKSSVVQTTFFTVLGFSIALLVIFTVIALIRSEFTTDVAKAAKGPYINRALKGIMHFILVPALSLVFVIGVNTLTRAVNKLFGGTYDSIATSVFKVTLTGSERTDSDFCQYLIDGKYNKNNVANLADYRLFLEKANGEGYEYFQDSDDYVSLGELYRNKASERRYVGDYADSILLNFSEFNYQAYQEEVNTKYDEAYDSGGIYATPDEITQYLGKAKIKLAGAEDYTQWRPLKARYDESFLEYTIYFDLDDTGDNGNEVFMQNYWDRADEYRIVAKTVQEADNNVYATENIFENCSTDEDVKSVIEQMMFLKGEGVSYWNTFQKVKIKVPNSIGEWTDMVDAKESYIPWQCVIISAPTTARMQAVSSPLYCGRLVNYFYDPADFHLIIGIAAAVIIGWNLMGVVLLLVKRALELSILFMISPVAVALYPLDDGAATNKWRQAWQGRILAPTTIVFAYNIFFDLISLLDINNITLPIIFQGNANPLGTLISLFWSLVIVMCMSSLLKSASKLLCDIVGAEDMIGNSSAMMDKAVKSAVSVAGAVATGGAGAAALAKNVFAGSKNSARGRERADRKAELKAANDEISDLEDKIKNEKDPRTKTQLQTDLANKTAERDKLKHISRTEIKNRRKDAALDVEFDKLKAYDENLTKEDIENKSDTYYKARRGEKNDKSAHQKARENVAKTAMGYMTMLLPKENEAVKFGNQLTDHKERRKLYMTSWDVSKAEKKEAEAKQRSDQKKQFNLEQQLRREQENKEANKPIRKTEADREDLALYLAHNADIATGTGTTMNVDNLTALINKANETGSASDKAALEAEYERLGANQAYKDLDSSSKTLRDAAKTQLDAAKQFTEPLKQSAALAQGMTDMLPNLANQLGSIKDSVLRFLPAEIKNAIQAAIIDAGSGITKFDKLNPQTQELLKAIMACQGGLSDLKTLMSTLRNIDPNKISGGTGTP